MRRFFTKSTVEAQVWCVKCGRETWWKIAGGRPQYCMPCMEALRMKAKATAPVAPVEQQADLFGGNE